MAVVLHGDGTITGLDILDSAQIGNQIVSTIDSDYIQAHTAPQIQTELVVKTSDFTAEAGSRYYINTSVGAVTMTLPLAPEFGQQVAFVDRAGSFSTTPAIMGRNGSNIMGLDSDMSLDVDYFSGTVENIDSTLGWKLI